MLSQSVVLVRFVLSSSIVPSLMPDAIPVGSTLLEFAFADSCASAFDCAGGRTKVQHNLALFSKVAAGQRGGYREEIRSGIAPYAFFGLVCQI